MNINPIKCTFINLSDDPVVDQFGIEKKDSGGNYIYHRESRCSLSEIIAAVKKIGVTESDYNKIFITSDDDACLSCTYVRAKTKEEIENETKEKENEIKEKNRQKELRKQDRINKRIEKEKILNSLTDEQKKVLGIK